MADKPPMLPPASEPFPGSRTPGWNDPPTMQYNPLTAATTGSGSGGRPRLNLNKRVAFPLQGMGGGVGVAAAAIKPTAIVQPNQSGTTPTPPNMSLPPTAASGVANTNQPIAVVHPMPNINAVLNSQHLPPPSPQTTITTNSSTEDARSPAAAAAAVRHIVLNVQSTNVAEADATARATSESNAVPAMFVPAVPRVNASNETSATTAATVYRHADAASASSYSTVQQI